MKLLKRIFGPKRYLYRDAVTGHFVSESFAKANPSTTVRERV